MLLTDYADPTCKALITSASDHNQSQPGRQLLNQAHQGRSINTTCTTSTTTVPQDEYLTSSRARARLVQDVNSWSTSQLKQTFPHIMASSPAQYPPYQSSSNAPAPPPKPSSQEVTRQSTPAGNQNQFAPQIPPPPPQSRENFGTYGPSADHQSFQQGQLQGNIVPSDVEDPGHSWLPKILEDKSSVTLLHILHAYD